MMTPTISNLPLPNTGAPSPDPGAAAEPGDLLSAEFAAMFASLCAAQQQVVPAEVTPAEVTETTIEFTPEITLKSEVPTVLFDGPKAELPVEFEALPPEVIPPSISDDVAVESEALLQSAPTASLVYNPNTVTTKGAVVTPRETRNCQLPAPVLPEIETPVTTVPPQTLEVATEEIPLPAPPPEALSEDSLEIKQATTLPVVVAVVPSKSGPIPVMGKPLPNEEPTKPELGETVTETVTVETTEPLKVRPQTEATQRISNLIATYLIEGAQNGSRPATAHFAGLEFELELDPAARQKRQSWKADSGRSMDLSLRPFSDLIADTVAQTKDASPVAQVSQRVVDLARTSTREVESLKFRLNPKELGEVDLTLTKHKDGSISAHLTTEREAARVSLARSVDELRQSLEQAGVQVAKLQVSSGATSMDNSRRHERDTTENSAQFRTTTSNSNELETSNSSLANNDRLLSLRA